MQPRDPKLFRSGWPLAKRLAAETDARALDYSAKAEPHEAFYDVWTSLGWTPEFAEARWPEYQADWYAGYGEFRARLWKLQLRYQQYAASPYEEDRLIAACLMALDYNSGEQLKLIEYLEPPSFVVPPAKKRGRPRGNGYTQRSDEIVVRYLRDQKDVSVRAAVKEIEAWLHGAGQDAKIRRLTIRCSSGRLPH